MPLLPSNDHKPDLSVSSAVQLRYRDSITGRIINVLVWDTCIEGHAIAAGWKQPLGKYDRAKMLTDVLDRIASQASRVYDAEGKPALVEMTNAQQWLLATDGAAA